jgi:hypothetical protein
VYPSPSSRRGSRRASELSGLLSTPRTPRRASEISGLRTPGTPQRASELSIAPSSRRPSSTLGANVRSKRAKKKETGEKSKAQQELEGGIDILPVAVGIISAGILAAPVILLMGLKLGMFAAIGGGAMGYTTGKMFSDSTSADAEITAEYQDMNEGKGEKAMKIRRRMRRIAEWQKFENNCHRAKIYLAESHERGLEERERRSAPLGVRGRVPRRRALSLGGQRVRARAEDRRSLSLPLPEEVEVEVERVHSVRRLTLRASSLTALPEEAEEDAVSLRSRRRSRSLDSSYNYELEIVKESRM